MPRQFTALSFANTFALANAYSDVVDFRFARSDDSMTSYVVRTLDEAKEIEKQGKDWVSSGGDARIKDSELTPIDHKIIKRDPGGMSVLYIATFGEAQLERRPQYPKPNSF